MPDLSTASVLNGLLTVQDVGRICQTDSTEWLESALRKRKFDFTMVGRKYRFTPAQAEAIISSLKVSAKHVPARDEVAQRRQQRGRSAA